MRGIDRFELMNKVASELQARMTFDDIARYVSSFGIPIPEISGSYGSKRVYAKDLLSQASEQTIIQIADELEIAHNYTVARAGTVTESKYWEPNHFRLFLSHLSSFKATAAKLRSSLRKYAISGFVAHQDIEPTKEWEDEIEAALFSMDALVAVVTPGFVESKWADQEIGVAIGRSLLVIPVMREAVPHGFMAKFQAVNGDGKSVREVSGAIFDSLVSSNQTRSRMLTCLVDATVLETTENAAISKLQILQSVASLPGAFLERLRDGAARSQTFQRSPVLKGRLDAFLQNRGIAASATQAPEPLSDDEIPF